MKSIPTIHIIINQITQFDGEDIVCVIRTAMEESRGLPTRQHDANFLLFKRVEKFRQAGGAEPVLVETLNK